MLEDQIRSWGIGELKSPCDRIRYDDEILGYQVGNTISLHDTILNHYFFLTSLLVFLLPSDIILGECALLDAFHELL